MIKKYSQFKSMKFESTSITHINDLFLELQDDGYTVNTRHHLDYDIKFRNKDRDWMDTIEYSYYIENIDKTKKLISSVNIFKGELEENSINDVINHIEQAVSYLDYLGTKLMYIKVLKRTKRKKVTLMLYKDIKTLKEMESSFLKILLVFNCD
jgi:hypothetical protein